MKPVGGSPPEAAAQWDARLRSPQAGAADRAVFQAWREENEANGQRFDELQSAILALQAASRSDPRLRSVREKVSREIRSNRRRNFLAAGLATLVVSGAGFAAWRILVETPESQTYATDAGQTSSITLADGSRIVLNAKTELRVRLSRRERALELVRGEAMFEVAPDASRPFAVTAGRRQLVAVGTAFDVRTDAHNLRVVMIEGKVRVQSAGSWRTPPAEQLIVAGQRLVAEQDSPLATIEAADLARDLLWREGKIVFDDTPLPVAVAEINRYASDPITIADAGLNGIRISGMFRTTTPDSFLIALTAYYPITVERAPAEVRLKRR
jgi:transmembrane sensor